MKQNEIFGWQKYSGNTFLEVLSIKGVFAHPLEKGENKKNIA
jgi:hypothetical protein